MRTAFLCLVAIHGLVHLLGFLKAFLPDRVSQLAREVSKPVGMLWLCTTLLFIIACVSIIVRLESWWVFAATGILLSQFLILRSWKVAKYGTLPNLLILVPVFISFLNSLPSSYQNRYRSEVERRLGPSSDSSLVGEKDLQRLPPAVRRYLQYVGAVGKPRVDRLRAKFRGSMKRSMEGGWMDITARQYDFFDEPARVFYIESTMFGIPFDGLHLYAGTAATMQIKVASLVQVADAKGEMMFRGETVTLFNDMCVLAPATLIDTAISWEEVDSLTVMATFRNKGATVSAELSFNEEGALTDFLSNDRYLTTDGGTYLNYPWSTPIRDYREVDGRMIPMYVEAVWETPEGEYLYARFNLTEIEYNVQGLN